MRTSGPSKHINKDTLPVFYNSYKKSRGWPRFSSKMLSWIAMPEKWISTSWRLKYLSRLIVENAPSHSPLGNLHPNIKVVYLLPNTVSLINQWIKEFTAVFTTLLLEEDLFPSYCCNWGWHWCNSGRVTSLTASRTLVGLGVMSQRSVWMTYVRRHSRDSSLT